MFINALESSHNGIAAVLKTAVRKDVGVRVPRSPQMPDSFYIYVLYSIKYKGTYVGQTNNIEERLKRHNRGLVASTKSHKPWLLIYFEKFRTRSEAMSMERWLKSGKGRELIKVLLREKQGIASA